MKQLALELWDDLRAKRLWPVAVALLLGLIAIPVLVIKPAAEPAPTAAQSDARQAQATPGLAAADEASRGSSGLGVFGSKDPFKPPAATLEPSTSEGAGTASPAGASPSPPASVGSGAGGGSPAQAPVAGSSPGAPRLSPAPRRVSPRTVAYAYVADVTFTRNGRSRRIRRLDRLDMLPSQESPLLIFLGVTSNGDHAVFLVDSTLEARGEGRFAPKASQCATLSIGAGAEHGFTDPEGNSFSLRVNEIRKVRVSSASASSSRRVRAHTATGSSRRFVPPVLADLVTVASPASHRSGRVAGDR
ncbi:MAG: hypothetical protein M3131_10805 [Actinomycetota bacterium]|nr:hypothetical protein [Actinomycetota bacterium]